MKELIPWRPLQRDWDDRFALDFAMTLEGSGSKPAQLLAEYEFEAADLERFSQEPLFVQRVEYFQNQLKEHGATFRVKAKAQAELLLDKSWDLIHNPDVSPAVVADLIKWTAKMGGLEPTKDSGPADGGVKINIIMGGASYTGPVGVRQSDE
jgi:hypothetical protein